MILGASLLFWALSFLVYVTRGQRRLVLAKLRVGAVLLGLTGLSMSAGCAPKPPADGQDSGAGDGTTDTVPSGVDTGGQDSPTTDDWAGCYVPDVWDGSTAGDGDTTETVSTGVTTGTSTDTGTTDTATSTDTGTTDTVSTGVTTDTSATSDSSATPNTTT